MPPQILNRHGAPSIFNEEKSEILIYDVIGDGYFYGGVTAKAVQAALDQLAGKPVKVRINSPGGSVFEANAIYNMLAQYAGEVTTIIDSLAASAASYLAMVGKTRKIAENGMIMIHEPSVLTWGDAVEHRKQAELLDKIRDVIVGMYRSRTGAEDKQLRDWMLAETWFTAEEAKAAGFVDEVLPNVSGGDSASNHATRLFNLEKFRNVPKDWAAAKENAGTPRLDRLAARLAAL